MAAAPTVPPYDIDQSRYDTKTYLGRLKHFATVTSPLTLFATKADLERAQQLVLEYKVMAKVAPEDMITQLSVRHSPARALDQVPLLVMQTQAIQEGYQQIERAGVGEGRQAWGREDAAGIWKAKQLCDSSLHPDTGLPIPLPFRMSAFVPTNLVIVAGMLMPNQGIRQIVFWQWANQSLNVAVNYSNANKSISMSTSEIATAYASATLASCGIAVGLNQLVPRLRLAPSSRALLTKLVPFFAVASAGCVNIALMRWKEAKEGIAVFAPSDPKTGKPSDKVLGKSETAGQLAIAQTAASRVLTNIPTLILPPLIMTALERRGAFAGRSRLQQITHLGLIGGALLVFLPPAIAVFPQRASIDPKKLEARFRELSYDHVEFSKGL